jgi:hypothetical protein
MRYKPLALAAAALMAGMLSFGGAQAANVMSGASAPIGITKIKDANIQQASHRWRRHRSGIFLGFGLAPLFYSPFYRPHYYQPYYYEPYYAQRYYYAPAGGSRHVRYCLNRYRTYNVRTNTFRGYDGYLHRCRSPYRY